MYVIYVSVISKTGTLDLDHQDRVGIPTSTVFEKIELFFITPLNLNCALIIYCFKAVIWLGEDTCSLRMQKRLSI